MLDESGHPILIDFGFCKKFKIKGEHISESDKVDSFRGDVNFASPHLLNNGKPSRRDDLYALAYLLIYKLNGD